MLNLLKYLAKFSLLRLGSHGGSYLLEEFNLRAFWVFFLFQPQHHVDDLYYTNLLNHHFDYGTLREQPHTTSYPKKLYRSPKNRIVTHPFAPYKKTLNFSSLLNLMLCCTFHMLTGGQRQGGHKTGSEGGTDTFVTS